jgi:hypothetical protein
LVDSAFFLLKRLPRGKPVLSRPGGLTEPVRCALRGRGEVFGAGRAVEQDAAERAMNEDHDDCGRQT